MVAFASFIVIYLFIFRKIFFSQLVPFPGDLLAAWFFPYNSGGWNGYTPWITHKEFILADVVRQIYPWRILSIELLKSGTLPLWNVFSFAGNPLLANVQSAALYPLNILFFFIEARWAWIVYIMVQPILATLFMYIFIRSLELSKVAAVFSGIAFAFTGYMMVWFEMGIIGHALLWLPFILWGITKFITTQKKSYIIFSALGITCSLLAGHSQTTAYVLIFSFAYLIYCGWNQLTKRFLLIGLTFLTLGISLAAIQIVPGFELNLNSPRDAISSTRTFHKFITPPSHIAMLFAPDFFGNPATNNFWGKDYGEFMSYNGVVALIFSVIGFYVYRKKKIVKLCMFFAIVAILIAFVPFIAHLVFISNIPILSTGLPSRTLVLLGIAFSIVSAFGIEALVKHKMKKLFIPIITILSIYAVLWIITFLPQFDPPKTAITQRNLIIPTGIAFLVCALLLLRKVSFRYGFIWIVIFSCMAFEYSYFLNKYLPMAPVQYMFPNQEMVSNLPKISGNDRVYGYDAAYVDNNLMLPWKVQSVEGYDPLYIKNYSELMRAVTTGKLERDLPRSDALLPKSSPNQDVHQKQKVMNLLGVKYVLDKTEPAPTKWDPNTDKFPAS